MKPTKEILVLFSYRNHKHRYIESLFARLTATAAAQGRNITLYRGSLKDLRIEVIDNQLRITESLTGRDLKSFDAVYFELWYKSPAQALAAAVYLNRHNTPFFSQEILHLTSLTKISDTAKLADGSVTLPQTFTSSRREAIQAFRKAKKPIKFPLIAKAADGYGGHDNYLVRDYAELREKLNANRDITFIIQEVIPNDCDYRCIVFGGQIRFVLERRRDAARDTHLNNTSAGAEGRQVPLETLTPEAQAMVLRAAHLVGRDSFAGVDLMLDKNTGQPYILEVNKTPQVENGAEIESKMTALLDYIEEIAS
jgi:glutathione synthase/RimK-type ligase-like ATP-grasp enzyme